MNDFKMNNFDCLLHKSMMTQQECAKFLDVRPDTIRKWVSGKVTPHDRVLFKMLQYIKGCLESAFFCFSEDSNIDDFYETQDVKMYLAHAELTYLKLLKIMNNANK